ncbi:calcium-dependent lipid-binding (CaLB domain) family protein [Artemisia annua]|uniref:Calcium-dependent lipid-binding (CaLB domain) family protein n=1 Tax=Artemisia annua TaxID=35608 RepID=A0A2U1KZH2_ARTAN|nr:calcium-dependent lipid-binding (CaLB domain) family protein [Artemisia annua]
MESCKLEIVLHSGKSLNNIKNFGTMDPYVVVWISGGGKDTKPLKTEVAKRGGSFPVWNYSMDFNISSMNNNYTLFCEIKHDGHMVDRNIGQVQIPFKDLLAGDTFGENVSYPVKISSGEVKGEIILSHKFSQSEVNEKDSSGKTVATQVASKAILLAGTAGLLVALDDGSMSASADLYRFRPA